MDKIISLLKQIGATDQLAKAVNEELKKFEQGIHTKYQTLYKGKLQKAKQVCVEEVESYKLDIANKVSLFLESKAVGVERKIEQQRAIEEGNAMSKLRNIREITENIEVASDAEMKALKTQLEQLTGQVKTLSEEKKRAEQAANRANAMALEVLRENKKPIKEEEDDKEDDDDKEEDDKDNKNKDGKDGKEEFGFWKSLNEKPKTKTKEEKCEDDDTCVQESRLTKRRVKSLTPKTTRRTLVESQMPTKKLVEPTSTDINIEQIAKTL